MRRPTLKAVRRTAYGTDTSTLEVELAGGWVPFDMIHPSNQGWTLEKIQGLCADNGAPFDAPFFLLFGADDPMPDGDAQGDDQDDAQQDGDAQDGSPVPSPSPDDQGDDQGEQDAQGDAQDAQGDQGEQDDEQGEQDAQDAQPVPQPESQSSGGTMEDIVRRIAGELDEQVRADLSASIGAVLDAHVAKAGVPVPVITRIEVRLPNVEKNFDGLAHVKMPELLENIALGCHTVLPGTPGTGKSHAAKQCADILGFEYADLSLSQDMPESRLFGGRSANGFIETPVIDAIRHAAENPDSGFVFTLDEMDAGRSGHLIGLNSLIANGWITLPNGDRCVIGSNLVFIGCMNTLGRGATKEFPGRFAIDPATLDRFDCIRWDVDENLEESLVRRWFPVERQDDATDWLLTWRIVRENVLKHRIPFWITPRGADRGAKKIAAGISKDRVMAQLVANKIDADVWEKIKP